MRPAAAFVLVMVSSFAYAQLGAAAGGFADAQQRDLERKHQLQMQREAEQYALELARIQAQNAAAQANDVSASAHTLAKDVSASGTEYLEICSSVEIPPNKVNVTDLAAIYRCQGFMEGLRDGVGVATTIIQHSNPALNLKGSVSDLGICFPDGVVLLQDIRVVLKYIREHPEQAHLPSAVLVVAANLQAFPCATVPIEKPPQTQ